MKTRIDTLLRGAVQQGDVPAVTAVATDVNGTIYEGGFGKTILGQDADMTPDTVVWIASMTKAVTGAVAMQQVERGTLKLDAPAKDVLPYLGEVQVLEGFDAEGKPRLRQPVRNITLRHLLTHTAGFGYDIWNPEILRYREAMDVPTIGSGLDKSLTTPLLFEPGARWQYGIGIDWAGKMVEAVTGRKLGRVMHDDLFGPLGMDSTGFHLTPAMRARMARIHHRKADGSLVADLKREVPQEPEFEAGGGGLYSTANDYLKFVRMVLDDGRSASGEVVMTPGYGRRNGRQRDGRFDGVPARDGDAGFVQRCRILPRRHEEVGPELHDQRRRGTDRPLAREPLLGRPPQHLLLDRPPETPGRRLYDPDPSFCRREVSAALLRLRERGLRALRQTPCHPEPSEGPCGATKDCVAGARSFAGLRMTVVACRRDQTAPSPRGHRAGGGGRATPAGRGSRSPLRRRPATSAAPGRAARTAPRCARPR